MAEPMAGGRIGYGLRSVVRHSLATLLATTALGVVAARAVDGTWAGGSSDWTNGTNWSSNPVVPDGTATFTNTGSTAVDNNNGVVVIGTVQFTSIAQAYSITIGKPFTVNAAGIVNNSGTTQNFEITSGNNLAFQNSSTARGGVGAGAHERRWRPDRFLHQRFGWQRHDQQPRFGDAELPQQHHRRHFDHHQRRNGEPRRFQHGWQRAFR